MTENGTVYLDDAARAVGVSRRTLYNWMNEGLLTYTTTQHGSQRSRRVSLADVRRIAELKPTDRWTLEGQPVSD